MRPWTRVLCLVCFAFAVTAFADGVAEKLERIRGHYGARQWTFAIGETPPLRYSLPEVTGAVAPKDWKRHAMFVSPRVGYSGLPKKFDWRAYGLPPVKNQGGCGSCWAFGTVGVMESIVKIRDGELKSFSEQQLISCNTHGFSCKGGWALHEMHVSPGAALSADFPYDGAEVACRPNLEYADKLTGWAYLGSANESRPSDSEIKAAIYYYGPVAATVKVSEAFQAYRGGIYNACDTGSPHILDIVGWDDTEGVWILRNSWGPKWGEQGYMRLKYGCNDIGAVTTFVTYKPACLPQPVAAAGDDVTMKIGESHHLGSMPVLGAKYEWSPSEGLDAPTVAMPLASPRHTTRYRLRVTTKCGTAEKMVQVTVVP